MADIQQQTTTQKRLRRKSRHQAILSGPKYRVSASGSIVDRHGAVLYESDCISDLSPEAKDRLAQLHAENPELEWEGDGIHRGAWEILMMEGLMPDYREIGGITHTSAS